MEIGSIAEWATAVAETAAVLVALFLPYFERRRANQKSSRNFKLMVRGLIQRAVQENDPHSIESFLNIATFTDAADRDEDTLATTRQILELFQNKDMDVTRRNTEIKALLETIQP
ncbi:hypothetical protein OZX57_03760 [Bifidobacterium sp. ESL0682]|uniref:hypothetical protein n=1 Tax=Bifidobacterium sp. ESL0682 TaxID=2983212 RepID=UPI0023F71708|nr:hypothetical protein [Bifidobacterium sp. ESL0682]WEV42551.1 hypothetical protein OZX57_03760 [Bifidobacterium sp. ESL0682]